MTPPLPSDPGLEAPRPGAAERSASPIVRVTLAAVAVIVLLAAAFPVPSWVALAAVGLIVAVALLSPHGAPDAAGASRPGTATSRRLSEIEAIVEAFPDPAILTGRSGLVHVANRLALERFGPMRAGDPLSFRLRVPALHEAVDRVAADGAARTIEWTERIPTERWFAAHVAAVGGPRHAASPDLLLVVVADDSERHLAERMRADFVANASHELRTPLAALTGFVETLIGPARNDPAARERFLGIMLEQAGRMKRLIDDLLSLSRIEMRAHVRPRDTVDLVPLVRRVADALGPLAAEARVALTVSSEVPAMPVLGDRDELTQVFANLVENALKYGAAGGKVEVAGRAERRHSDAPPSAWLVSVRDHGPGIAPEHLPRLTERFYRVDVETSRAKLGTGLGLAIVKHILARHRARLTIESEPGQGAVFTVRLEADPAARANPQDLIPSLSQKVEVSRP